MSKRRAIPHVPPDTPRSLRPLLTSIREALQVLDNSKRGSKLDAAVTFRDLEKLDLASLVRSSGVSGGSSSGGTGDGELTDPTNVETPTAPTGVTVAGGIDFALVRWDLPTYSGHSHTDIFRYTLGEVAEGEAQPVFGPGDAVRVGSAVAGVFTEPLPPNSEHYYWVRHVNILPEPQAEGDPINYGPWHDELGTYVKTAISYDDVIEDVIADVIAGLDIWQSDFADALSILDNRSLELVLASNGTVNLLNSRVESVESTASAYYDQTVQTVASQIGSATTRVDKVEASVFRRDGDGALLLDETGEPLLASAFIDSVDAAVATADGALMAAIGDTLTVNDGSGTSYSLSEVMQVSVDNAGAYSSQWGIKASINDLQYGVGFVTYTEPNGTERTAFHVAADTFSVYDPAAGTELIPFVVRDGKVYIKEALIDVATITTLIANTIITSELFAGKRVVSPIIEGGAFTGGSLNINNKTIIDSNGLLRAINAVIEGRIVATEGELDNVVINDTCEVNGTVYADNIEGDVLDRSVIVVGDEFTVGANSNYTMVSGDIVPGRVGPKSNRFLTISGLAFDHQNGGGSSSNFDVVLYLNGNEVQRFHSRNVEEEGSVTVSLGALIPKSTTVQSFRVALKTDVNDNILVQQSAIIVDVVKAGSTITNVSALFDGSTPPAGSGRTPGAGGGVYVNQN